MNSPKPLHGSGDEEGGKKVFCKSSGSGSPGTKRLEGRWKLRGGRAGRCLHITLQAARRHEEGDLENDQAFDEKGGIKKRARLPQVCFSRCCKGGGKLTKPLP